MRINFDLDDLQVFLAVMDTGSFHRAADVLALSQSAVTRRVRKLEEALDSLLFERTTRSVKPTLAARRLRSRAEAIVDNARETARAMRDESVAFAHQRSLVVTLAIIPTVIAGLLPPAIRAFRDAGHAARLRLLDVSAGDVSQAVAAGEADFGVSSMPAPDPALVFEALFEERMVLAVPTGHPSAQSSSVTWDDLRGQDLILPARRTGNRVLIDDALARSDHAPGWVYETERSTTALSLVAEGVGVAILPLSVLKAQSDPRVFWKPIEAPEITRPVGLITRKGQAEGREAVAFKKAISEVSRSATWAATEQGQGRTG